MKTQYFVFLHRPGPNWLKEKPVHEQPLEGHFQYMAQLSGSKILVLGGGFLDHSGAMGVLKAGSLDEAETLVAEDPAVCDGIVKTSVHPWFVTVGGTIEQSAIS